MKRPDLRIVNGKALHVVLDGADRGGTPVALVGGLAGNWFDWDSVTALLAADRVIVRFDRPGFGFSPASTEAPTARGEADRIAAVLDDVTVTGPVIVVGHSLGGFYAEAFARLHPDRTAGLILLDASIRAGLRGRIPRSRRIAAARGAAALISRTGLQRVLGPAVGRLLNQAGFAPDSRDQVRAIFRDPRYLEAALVEDAVYPDLATEVARLRSTHPLPAVPVTVAVAHTGRPTPWGAAWVRMNRGLATALGGRCVVLRPAHHYAMIDQPGPLAELIVDPHGA
jgi:pimeloyl-ACP methyl ester carboxylesterase